MRVFEQFKAAYHTSIKQQRQRNEAWVIRLTSKERFKNAIEFVMLMGNRRRARSEARKRIKIRNEALASVRRTLEQAGKFGAKNIETVYNVALYLLQLDQDLAYFTTDMVLAIGDRRRAFVAKHEAVLLREAAEDIPQLLGKKFRDAIATLSVSESQVRAINDVSSELNAFWQQNREFLGQIRNVLAAHREQDALAYARALDSLEPLEVMRRAAELSQLLERLVTQLIAVGQVTSSMSAILTDIVKSKKADPKQTRTAA